MSVRNILMAAAGAQSGAYRYWRILVSSNNGDTNVLGIAEVELRGSVGGADLTASSTPVTGSTNMADYEPTRTIDNDYYSWWWAYTSFPQWLVFDLATSKDVKSIAITSISIFGSARAPKDFSIQGSNDGVNFTTVKSFSSTGWAASETRVFNL